MNFEHQMTIFFVDDDYIYLNYMSELLNQNPRIKLHSFNTPEACLKQMHLDPNLIILDYYLNGAFEKRLNGLETIKKIRHQSEASKIIMLSSDKNIQQIQECLNQGANGFVLKDDYTASKINSIIQHLFFSN